MNEGSGRNKNMPPAELGNSTAGRKKHDKNGYLGTKRIHPQQEEYGRGDCREHSQCFEIVALEEGVGDDKNKGATRQRFCRTQR